MVVKLSKTKKSSNNNNNNNNINNNNNNNKNDGRGGTRLLWSSVAVLFVGIVSLSFNNNIVRYTATALGEVLIFQEATGTTATTANKQQTQNTNQTTTKRHRFNQQHDATVIVTSNLIPTHPKIDMINTTIYSLVKHFIGFPLDTPIFITIDRPPPKYNTAAADLLRLDQYIENITKASFYPLTNVTVLPMTEHRHLSGSINQVLPKIDTEFVYILQHDLSFQAPVDHVRLMESMKMHPDILYNVRFRLNFQPRIHASKCFVQFTNGTDNVTEITTSNGLQFFTTSLWSDNNHVARTDHYRRIMREMGMLERPMEFTRTHSAARNCSAGGQQMYGSRYDIGRGKIPTLYHLDGRLSKNV